MTVLTTTLRSKLKIEQPDEDYAAGTGLHNLLRDAYIKIGDNINCRLLATTSTLTSGNNVDLEHNLRVDFNYLSCQLFIRDNANGDLTYIDSGGSPDLNLFTIAATPSFEETHIRLTNNSGDPIGPQYYAVVVSLGPKIFTPRYVVNTYTAKPGDIIYANSSGGGFGITLPPADDCIPGTRIEIIDPTGDHFYNSISVGRNGQNINGLAADWSCNIDNGRTIFEYINDSLDWRTF